MCCAWKNDSAEAPPSSLPFSTNPPCTSPPPSSSSAASLFTLLLLLTPELEAFLLPASIFIAGPRLLPTELFSATLPPSKHPSPSLPSPPPPSNTGGDGEDASPLLLFSPFLFNSLLKRKKKNEKRESDCCCRTEPDRVPLITLDLPAPPSPAPLLWHSQLTLSPTVRLSFPPPTDLLPASLSSLPLYHPPSLQSPSFLSVHSAALRASQPRHALRHAHLSASLARSLANSHATDSERPVDISGRTSSRPPAGHITPRASLPCGPVPACASGRAGEKDWNSPLLLLLHPRLSSFFPSFFFFFYHTALLLPPSFHFKLAYSPLSLSFSLAHSLSAAF